MNLIYKKAALTDIEDLTRTRILVLRAANQLDHKTDMSFVQQKTRAYYKDALPPGDHTAYLVYDDETFVGAGGISFYSVMPTYHNPTGQKAYIMNMYTIPEYRRKGVAYKTLNLLVAEAAQRNVSHITLEATDAGRPLYEKYGFIQMNHEMELVQCGCHKLFI